MFAFNLRLTRRCLLKHAAVDVHTDSPSEVWGHLEKESARPTTQVHVFVMV
jgi:hypothetical protein